MIYHGRISTEDFYNEQCKYIDFFLYPILQVTYTSKTFSHLKLSFIQNNEKRKTKQEFFITNRQNSHNRTPNKTSYANVFFRSN